MQISRTAPKQGESNKWESTRRKLAATITMTTGKVWWFTNRSPERATFKCFVVICGSWCYRRRAKLLVSPSLVIDNGGSGVNSNSSVTRSIGASILDLLDGETAYMYSRREYPLMIALLPLAKFIAVYLHKLLKSWTLDPSNGFVSSARLMISKYSWAYIFTWKPSKLIVCLFIIPIYVVQLVLTQLTPLPLQ